MYMVHWVTLYLKSVVKGYHVYKDNWIPEVGDKFQVKLRRNELLSTVIIANCEMAMCVHFQV